VLQRDFEAKAPNQKWLADMTYVPTDEGWLYLALVLDLYARKVVGWAMSETMPQELTLCALDVALGWREPVAGLVHHSDRGSQYAADDYRKKLKARGITVSMSRKGDCWDNAPMESVNGTLKVECVHDVHFETRDQARQAIVEYIGYYNTERRHSSLGNIAPAEFERRWRAGIKPEEQRAALVKHRVTHRRPVSGSSQATEPAVRGYTWTPPVCKALLRCRREGKGCRHTSGLQTRESLRP
jgi:transposase InsO family protein